jgi:hypothetical protein
MKPQPHRIPDEPVGGLVALAVYLILVTVAWVMFIATGCAILGWPTPWASWF